MYVYIQLIVAELMLPRHSIDELAGESPDRFDMDMV